MLGRDSKAMDTICSRVGILVAGQFRRSQAMTSNLRESGEVSTNLVVREVRQFPVMQCRKTWANNTKFSEMRYTFPFVDISQRCPTTCYQCAVRATSTINQEDYHDLRSAPPAGWIGLRDLACFLDIRKRKSTPAPPFTSTQLRLGEPEVATRSVAPSAASLLYGLERALLWLAAMCGDTATDHAQENVAHTPELTVGTWWTSQLQATCGMQEVQIHLTVYRLYLRADTMRSMRGAWLIMRGQELRNRTGAQPILDRCFCRVRDDKEVFASQNKILPVPIPGIPPIDPALLQNFWLADAELPILINDFEISLAMHHFFAGPDALPAAGPQVDVDLNSQVALPSPVTASQNISNRSSLSPLSSAPPSSPSESDYSVCAVESPMPSPSSHYAPISSHDHPSPFPVPIHQHDSRAHTTSTLDSGYALSKHWSILVGSDWLTSTCNPNSRCSAHVEIDPRRSSVSIATRTPYRRAPRAESQPIASSSRQTLDAIPPTRDELPDYVICRFPDCPIPDRKVLRDREVVRAHINAHKPLMRKDLRARFQVQKVEDIQFECTWEGCTDDPNMKESMIKVASLTRHGFKHFEVHEYPCRICGHSFVRSDGVQRHEITCKEKQEKDRAKAEAEAKAQADADADALSRWRHDHQPM
ncbi:hypothetical protein CERSUDRAFT_74953 [Gelatoporia subvermispora B]|uniref:C2H2-type domain-containing protein n=1 Tax=Ceriporiopsis subvermispora (strain B) TaxID=914234 RepID=M2RA69_CERS8|nr:hypothetical protein CERSUDRAFT_74953 [Gelatoporia subvermispora B]